MKTINDYHKDAHQALHNDEGVFVGSNVSAGIVANLLMEIDRLKARLAEARNNNDPIGSN